MVPLRTNRRSLRSVPTGGAAPRALPTLCAGYGVFQYPMYSPMMGQYPFFMPPPWSALPPTSNGLAMMPPPSFQTPAGQVPPGPVAAPVSAPAPTAAPSVPSAREIEPSSAAGGPGFAANGGAMAGNGHRTSPHFGAGGAATLALSPSSPPSAVEGPQASQPPTAAPPSSSIGRAPSKGSTSAGDAAVKQCQDCYVKVQPTSRREVMAASGMRPLPHKRVSLGAAGTPQYQCHYCSYIADSGNLSRCARGGSVREDGL